MPLELTRREFLAITAAAGVGAIAPSLWRRLTAAQWETLLVIARTLFPHPAVADEVYLKAVDGIDVKSGADDGVFEIVSTGVAKLEEACGGVFAGASEQKRIGLLKSIESGDFFRFVYRETLHALYGSRDAWALFV